MTCKSETIEPCKFKCTKVKVALFFVVFLGSIILLLRYGNPQWSRYIFMFQAYVYPADNSLFLNYESNPNGVTRAWDKCGRLCYEERRVDNKLNGIQRQWHLGVLVSEEQYDMGELHGVSSYWYSNGQKESVKIYEHGNPVGKWIEWDKNGSMTSAVDYGDSVNSSVE